MNRNDLTYPCGKCMTQKLGSPPHGDQECPMARDEHDREQKRRDDANATYIEMLSAQRDYYLRAQMPVLDMGEAMRAVTNAIGGER